MHGSHDESRREVAAPLDRPRDEPCAVDPPGQQLLDRAAFAARRLQLARLFERYIDLKRAEWEEYRVQVTEWELERYLSIL